MFSFTETIVREAHAAIEEHTCIYFWKLGKDVTVPEGRPYIGYDIQSQACHARLGRENTMNRIEFGRCKSFASILHETMHALGFIHEHQRPDSYYFVVVDYENIPFKNQKNFKPVDSSRFDIPLNDERYYYDYSSIMHYKWNEFALYNYRYTLKPICNVPNWKLG
ncbi:high choriolytic enzyme 1-like protein, partial [Leptotrombidium deliense]